MAAYTDSIAPQFARDIGAEACTNCISAPIAANENEAADLAATWTFRQSLVSLTGARAASAAAFHFPFCDLIGVRRTIHVR